MTVRRSPLAAVRGAGAAPTPRSHRVRRALVLAVWLVGCACPAGTEVAIDDRAFCVDVATTEAARARGLRGSPPLGEGEGLLLTFEVEGEICIVNDGVPFAIDVAWARTDGFVTAIERAESNDPTVRCHPTTRDVLEVRAGALDGITPGARLVR
jgi:uncharacterized membrane protein (UPF0127 family)